MPQDKPRPGPRKEPREHTHDTRAIDRFFEVLERSGYRQISDGDGGRVWVPERWFGQEPPL